MIHQTNNLPVMKVLNRIIWSFLLISSLHHVLISQVSIEKQDPKCHNSEDGWIEVVVTGADGPFTYTWSHDSNWAFRKAVNLKPGDYTVTVSTEQGCSQVKYIRLHNPPVLTANIGTVLIRSQSNGCGQLPTVEYRLTGFASGGTPPYTSNWGTNHQITQVAPFTRTVIFKDTNGCEAQKTSSKQLMISQCSFDPNDILGPPGYGDEKWVSKNEELNYTVRFENDPEFATAPASSVLVTVAIPDKINPFSLKLSDFNFGDFYFNVPENRSFYQTRLNLQEQSGFFVDLTAGLDIAQNRIFWLFQTIDPATGQPPIDPLIGFLPVNDTLTGSGEGFVNFSVTPSSSAITGDQVSFQANIIFDAEEPLLTNIWTNTIDAVAPSSIPSALPDTIENPMIALQWLPEDDPGGVGVQSTKIFISRNNGPYSLLFHSEDSNSFNFNGIPGNHYAFRFESMDYVGNVETNPVVVSTFVKPERSIDYLPGFPDFVCVYDTFYLDFSFIRINQVDLFFSLDSGKVYQPLAMNINIDSFPYPWYLADSLLTSGAMLRVYDSEHDYEFITDVFGINNLPNVLTDEAESICSGKMVVLRANGANDYYWTPENLIGNPSSPIPNAFPKQSTWFYVTGTDAFGCSNVDSVFVEVRSTSRDTVPTVICLGDSIFLGGAWRSEPGLYADIFINTQQCDSIIVTDLAVIDPCVWGNGPIVFVDTTATGLNDGSTWVNALTNLQRALNFARKYVDVEEIWVAEGVYFTTNSQDRTISFELSDQIKVYGGFEGVENDRNQRVNGLYPTVLSGDIGIFGDTSDNAFHVVKINQNCTDCVLDMIVIESGNANDSLSIHQEGAGLLSKGKASLKNIKITKNHSLGPGAAILNRGNNAELTIEGLDVWQNTSGINSFIYNHDGSTIIFVGTENKVRH